MNFSLCTALESVRLDNCSSASIINSLQTIPNTAKITTLSSHKFPTPISSLFSSINCSNVIDCTLSSDQGHNYDFSQVPFADLIKCRNLNISVKYLSESQDLDMSGMTSLEELRIGSSLTKMSIKSLKIPSSLKSIYISNTNLSSIIGLDNAVNLNKFCINSSNISSIEFVRNLKNISGSSSADATRANRLDLQDNNITDLSPLLDTIVNGNISYKELDISSNSLIAVTSSGVDNIDVIKKLHAAGLTYLNIKENTAITEYKVGEVLIYVEQLKEIFSNPGDHLIYQ